MKASNRIRVVAVAAGAALATALAALAAPPTEPAPANASTGQLVLPNASVWTGAPLRVGAGHESTTPLDGMRVAIDGRGRITAPNARQARELEAALRQDRAEPSSGRLRAFAATQVEHADGTVSMELDPQLMSYTVLHLAADGAVHEVCVDGETAAAARVLAPVPTPVREEN